MENMIKHIALKSRRTFRIIVVGIITNNDVFRRYVVFQITYLRKSLHRFFVFRIRPFQNASDVHMTFNPKINPKKFGFCRIRRNYFSA